MTEPSFLVFHPHTTRGAILWDPWRWIGHAARGMATACGIRAPLRFSAWPSPNNERVTCWDCRWVSWAAAFRATQEQENVK